MEYKDVDGQNRLSRSFGHHRILERTNEMRNAAMQTYSKKKSRSPLKRQAVQLVTDSSTEPEDADEVSIPPVRDMPPPSPGSPRWNPGKRRRVIQVATEPEPPRTPKRAMLGRKPSSSSLGRGGLWC
jgi:hypothetical protein